MTNINHTPLSSQEETKLTTYINNRFAQFVKVIDFSIDETYYPSKCFKTKNIIYFNDGVLLVSIEHKYDKDVLAVIDTLKQMQLPLQKPDYIPLHILKAIYDYANKNDKIIKNHKVELPLEKQYEKMAQKIMQEKTLVSTYFAQGYRGICDDDWVKNVLHKKVLLKKEGQYLEFPNSKIIFRSSSIALFADGTVYCANSKHNKEDIISFLGKHNINVTNVERYPHEVLELIYSQARQELKNKMVERSIKPKDEFVKNLLLNELLKDNQDAAPEIITKFVMTTGGRTILANNLNRAQEMAVSRYLSDKYSKMAYLTTEYEYVPQNYIDEIYKKANKDDAIKNAQPKVKEGISSTIKEFIKSLFANNNKCITIADTDVSLKDREVVAIFSDGTVVVSKDAQMHYSSQFIKQKHLKLGLKEDIVVDKECLHAIYKKANELQDGFKETSIKKLKKAAKILAKQEEIKLHEAQELIAKAYGFNHWKALTEVSEDFACYLLKDINFDAREDNLGKGLIKEK